MPKTASSAVRCVAGAVIGEKKKGRLKILSSRCASDSAVTTRPTSNLPCVCRSRWPPSMARCAMLPSPAASASLQCREPHALQPPDPVTPGGRAGSAGGSCQKSRWRPHPQRRPTRARRTARSTVRCCGERKIIAAILAGAGDREDPPAPGFAGPRAAARSGAWADTAARGLIEARALRSGGPAPRGRGGRLRLGRCATGRSEPITRVDPYTTPKTANRPSSVVCGRAPGKEQRV